MIWDFEAGIGVRLIAVAVASIALGTLLLAAGGAIARPVGIELVSSGVLVALLGRAVSRRSARQERTSDASARDRERIRVRRALLALAALGLVVAGVTALVVHEPAAADPALGATGAGVVALAAFLSLFSASHAAVAPVEAPRLAISGFDGPEHAAFTLSGQRGTALLVHGFGATPAEMWPLASALHEAGWTTAGPLLPGFGPGLARLPETRFEDWLAEVERVGAGAVAAGGRPLLLLGHSMGGALALAAARSLKPDGLVLLAPFWWVERPWQSLAGAIVRLVRPSGMRPFRGMDLGDPRVRSDVSAFLGGLDLDDPDVVETLRDLAIPVAFISSIGRGTRSAVAGARHLTARVLVLQGTRDDLVPPARTRHLAAAFGRPIELQEVDDGHALADPEGAAWTIVRDAVLEYAAGLLVAPSSSPAGAAADPGTPDARRAPESHRTRPAD